MRYHMTADARRLFLAAAERHRLAAIRYWHDSDASQGERLQVLEAL